MSAYINDPETLDLLVDAAVTYGIISDTDHNKTLTWSVLHIANVKSVHERYGGDVEALPGPIDKSIFNRGYQQSEYFLIPELVHKTAQCYTYQSCEASDWDESVVKELIDSIVAHAKNRGSSDESYLYEQMPWGVGPGEDIPSPALVG